MDSFPLFKNRQVAGSWLAEKLQKYKNNSDVIVLALPRGGVPIGYEIAKELNVKLEAFIVRKLGLPGQEELAIGAIASGGVRVINEEIINLLGIPFEEINKIASVEELELKRREKVYGVKLSPYQVQKHIIILVDDGLATGATMKAAVKAIRKMQPSKLVVAVPISSKETCKELENLTDEIICAKMPEPFYGVGIWYEDFSQVSDFEVQELLRLAHASVNSREKDMRDAQ